MYSYERLLLKNRHGRQKKLDPMRSILIILRTCKRRNFYRAVSKTNFKLVLNMWLRNIKNVSRLHQNDLDGLDNEEQRVGGLIELNLQNTNDKHFTEVA